jgi:carbon starvation protein
MVLADGHREKPQLQKRISFPLITLIPLVWLLAVTFTAGVEKIWHPDPRIGFLAQANTLKANSATLENNLLNACAAKLKAYTALGSYKFNGGNAPEKIMELEARHNTEEQKVKTAGKALATNRTLRFNNQLDAAVTGAFLVLVAVIVWLSLREWFLLLSKRKPAVLHETEPVWLPDYALKESGQNLRSAAGAAALALGLAKELSGETQFERARQQACVCEQPSSDQKVFAKTTEERFSGVRRCC